MKDIANVTRRLVNFFLVVFSIIAFQNCWVHCSEVRKVTLRDEECMPRREIIPIDSPNYGYNPSMVSLYRCSGAVKNVSPALKTCEKNSSEMLDVQVSYFYDKHSRLSYRLENHTSCVGKCVYNESVCSSTQNWDPENCKCVCNHKAALSCPENYSWNPNLCQCQCSISCIRRQIVDLDECSCTCKPKFYQRCNKRNKILVENNCTCISPKAQVGLIECNFVPTKWAVIVIVLSFIAFFVLAFDCILYSRKSGCMHHVTHIFANPNTESNGENTPMNEKVHRQEYTVA